MIYKAIIVTVHTIIITEGVPPKPKASNLNIVKIRPTITDNKNVNPNPKTNNNIKGNNRK